MGNLLFFSDLHLNGDGSRESLLEKIVSISNQESVDRLIFGGDAIDQDIEMNVINALEEMQAPKEAIVNYIAMDSGTRYKEFNAILEKSKSEKHGIYGNHDGKNSQKIVKCLNTQPDKVVGKYYFENAPVFPLQDLNIENSPDSYIEFAENEKPPIMLWHQGPYDVPKYNIKIPDRVKALGKNAKINLCGHQHGSFYEFDGKSLTVDMCTKEGYFAVVDHDDNYNPTGIKVYKLNSGDKDVEKSLGAYIQKNPWVNELISEASQKKQSDNYQNKPE